MNFALAMDRATDIQTRLSPFCDKCQIGGSIRRKRQAPRDIEIVCIPKQIRTDLFESEFVRHPAFVGIVGLWPAVRGDAETGRYTQRLLHEGIKLDLFMCRPDNWGLILAIRTGSADWVRFVLAARWVQLGYHSYNGRLCKNGVPVETPDERALFDLLNIPWIEPQDREWTAP